MNCLFCSSVMIKAPRSVGDNLDCNVCNIRYYFLNNARQINGAVKQIRSEGTYYTIWWVFNQNKITIRSWGISPVVSFEIPLVPDITPSNIENKIKILMAFN